jgi:hypothetical protein
MRSGLYWKKAKALAMLANRRQWQREYLPSETPWTEIETGESYFIATETSTTNNETIIIAEA